MGSARDAIASRRSQSKVTDVAPSHEEILEFVTVAARVADHSSLRPWRLIELRGAARERLGAAIAEAEHPGENREPSTKPLRAPLLIAVVSSRRESVKVAAWEQDAVASGIAHMLTLLLDEAGWGVMWRTGHYTRSSAVAAMHGLGEHERLLGWLYVGGKPDPKEGKGDGAPKRIDAREFVSVLQ
ncbi:nitroreductase [Planctomonas sp. JC2975]|uniref:nitroreductase family protein n=1 Tax=Planctomonas sp. JC2975 TaxID=2729626 RepID=UPI001476674D|nr:nitroreductase family protein [Planctomonas sp. JC2975]NNC11666.1 nitroreductase [Planctomonas sp. JC2975]